MLWNRFLCARNETTLVKNPFSNSSSFLFRLFDWYKWYHFIGIWDFFQSWRWRWRAWKIAFKISGKISKLKRSLLCCNVLLVSDEIIYRAHVIFLIHFFMQSLSYYGLDFVGFRLFDWFPCSIMLKELLMNVLGHLKFIRNKWYLILRLSLINLKNIANCYFVLNFYWKF